MEKELEKLCAIPLVMFKEFFHAEIPHKVTVTSRVQRVFRPQRFVLPREEGKHWIIHDIQIGNTSQMVGEVPGDIFSSTAFDTNIEMDTAQVEMDIRVIAQNISDSPKMFMGSFIGTGVDDQGGNRRLAIGISSMGEVPPTNHLIAIHIDDILHKFNRYELVGGDWALELKRSGIELGTYEDLRLSVDCTLNPRMIFLYYKDETLFAIEEATDRCILKICPSKNEYQCNLGGI